MENRCPARIRRLEHFGDFARFWDSTGPRDFPATPRKKPRFVGVNPSSPLHFRHLCYSLTSQVTLFPHLTPGSRKNLLSVPATFPGRAALRSPGRAKKSQTAHSPAPSIFKENPSPGEGFRKEIAGRPRILEGNRRPAKEIAGRRRILEGKSMAGGGANRWPALISAL